MWVVCLLVLMEVNMVSIRNNVRISFMLKVWKLFMFFVGIVVLSILWVCCGLIVIIIFELVIVVEDVRIV